MNFTVLSSLLYPFTGMVISMLRFYLGRRHIRSLQEWRMEPRLHFRTALWERLAEVKKKRFQRAMEAQKELIELGAGEEDRAG